MINNLSKNNISKLKAIGIYQIMGGIIGLAVTIWVIAKSTSMLGLLFLLFLIAIALYAYSIYCGVLLIKQKPKGLSYSLVNQYLQLINFSIIGYAFKYISGLFLTVGIELTNSIDFHFGLGVSTWQININNDEKEILITFNFVALFLIIFIEKLKKKINTEQKEI